MADETTAAPPAPAAALQREADAIASAASSNQDQLQPMGDEPGAPLAPHADPWEAPRTGPNGFAMDGHDLPINLRLRALVLADKGLAEDPAGSIDADGIASAAASLAAYDARYSPISGASKADLEKIAESEGVDLTAANNNAERESAIQAARPARIF